MSQMNQGLRKPPASIAAICLVVAAGVFNVVLVAWSIAESVSERAPPSDELLSLVGGFAFLLVLLMVPVVLMLSIALRPIPAGGSRTSLLVGAVLFAAFNVLLNLGILASENSTATFGFLFSVPVLLLIAGITLAVMAYFAKRPPAQGGLS